MEICSKEKCTACFACVNACPHGCITMQEDIYGALYPKVDESKCVKCNLCVKSCPNNVAVEYNYPIACHAAWNVNHQDRMICASGGIGTMLSECAVKRGGIVFGCRYDKNLTPIISSAETVEELEHFKGSRYVQGIVGNDTYRWVKKSLQNGRFVLYIGTPCQIAGLRTFLKKDYDNLVSVDLICHGVSPTRYLKEEIDFLREKYRFLKGVEISDVRFRGNDGNNFCLTLWNKARQKLFPREQLPQKLFHKDEAQQYYIAGFLQGVTLRENCYKCSYARPERVSDITIGDFIGLGKHIPFHPNFNYDAKNVSVVTVNTSKGRRFYDSAVKGNPDIVSVERAYEERLEYKPSLMYPFDKHPLTEEFRNQYIQHGFAEAIRMVMHKDMHGKQQKAILNTFFRRIPRKIFNKITRWRNCF